uniref:GH18 domain-containing protein n=1 Tax=Anopheles coluzzii TaxID=1518534 RepID=A0A8W7Q0X0_ANOCL
MSKQQGKYELLKEDTKLRRQHTYIQSCLLVALCAMSSLTVYATWTMIYRQNLIIPPALLGLNAPLYRRANEQSLLGTLNINTSVHYWLSAGLDKSKLILGLPTYGHSFTLVNPFNTRIGAPASSYGRVGTFGFASYSETCWFRRYNIYVHQVYDVESCSPYLYAGSEWISYEDERSLECKAKYIKAHGFGGAMIFSLNTDDFGSYCADNALYRDRTVAGDQQQQQQGSFPLLRKVRSVLVDGAGANRTVPQSSSHPQTAEQQQRIAPMATVAAPPANVGDHR